MTQETEYGNYNVVSDYIAAHVVPAYVAKDVTQGGFTRQTMEKPVDSYKFTLDGSLTAATVGESAAATASELTQTSVTVSSAKVKVYTKLTEEVEVYIGSSKIEDLIKKSGEAIMRHYMTAIATLAAGFSQVSGTSGATFTVADLLTAAYLMDNGNVPGALRAFLSPKQAFQIRNELKGSASTMYNQNAQNGFESAQNSPNGFKGEVFDIPVFSSSLVTNNGTDFAGMATTQEAIAEVWGNGGNALVKMNNHVQNGYTEIGVSMFYGLSELKDDAGVKLRSGI